MTVKAQASTQQMQEYLVAHDSRMLKIQFIERKEITKIITPPVVKETETEETKSETKRKSQLPPGSNTGSKLASSDPRTNESESVMSQAANKRTKSRKLESLPSRPGRGAARGSDRRASSGRRSHSEKSRSSKQSVAASSVRSSKRKPTQKMLEFSKFKKYINGDETSDASESIDVNMLNKLERSDHS